MKKFFISLIFLSTSAFAQNIKLDSNQVNCGKVNGFGANDRVAIAEKFKVSVASVQFIGAQWKWSSGLMQCIFVFDTAKGPVNCPTQQLLSDDQGKTAFGSVSSFGKTLCGF